MDEITTKEELRSLYREELRRLSKQERLALELIARAGAEGLRGLDIVKRSGGRIKRGHVYVMLDRMERKGVVQTGEEERGRLDWGRLRAWATDKGQALAAVIRRNPPPRKGWSNPSATTKEAPVERRETFIAYPDWSEPGRARFTAALHAFDARVLETSRGCLVAPHFLVSVVDREGFAKQAGTSTRPITTEAPPIARVETRATDKAKRPYFKVPDEVTGEGREYILVPAFGDGLDWLARTLGEWAAGLAGLPESEHGTGLEVVFLDDEEARAIMDR
jgi:DNA-binding PadR family transcriptional regulator